MLALTPAAFQLDAGLVALRTLKRRRPVVREVPVPPAIIAALDARFGLRAAQAAGDTDRLWPCSRVTAWRQVKARLAAVGVHGSHGCPKGLPVFRLGSLLCARRSVLLAWIAEQESRAR